MQNLGEEICGEYLKYINKCEFVTYNVTNPDIQGEIDVIGINLESKIIYVCEVAIHTSGLQYVKNNRPDDYNRFINKFNKDISYAKEYFPDYKIKPMLWSPIVKISGKNAQYNTLVELKKDIMENLKLKLSREFEVFLSIASGTGKEHMALISALLSIPVGIRLVVYTDKGVEFVN